jgi:hypothetical protein
MCKKVLLKDKNQPEENILVDERLLEKYELDYLDIVILTYIAFESDDNKLACIRTSKDYLKFGTKESTLKFRLKKLKDSHLISAESLKGSRYEINDKLIIIK